VTPSTARHFDLSPSLPYAALIVAVHLCAGLALAAVIPGGTGLALAALAGALGGLAAYRKALLLAADSPRRVIIEADSSGRIELRDGRSVPVAAGQRRVTRLWLVLPTGSLRAVLLTRGMPGAADFRRLCVWGLWGKLPGGAEPSPATPTP
jgi:hypothetical protein